MWKITPVLLESRVASKQTQALLSLHSVIGNFHPHFVIRIFPSAFYHPHFSIRILSSAIRHPPPSGPHFTETPENDLDRKVMETGVTKDKFVSSRRLVRWGIARKRRKAFSLHFAHIFSLAVFRSAPQVCNFLPRRC